MTKLPSSLPRVPIDELQDFPQLTHFLTRLAQESWVFKHTIKTSISSSSIASGMVTISIPAVGVVPDDHVEVTKPTDTTDIGIVSAWCSATDTVKVKLHNVSSGAVTIPAETYKISTTRF